MKFVFDLDGTICYRGKPLGDRMIEALDALAADGHDLIFASARPIRDLLPVLPAHLHQGALVGGNGGFVHRGGRSVAVTRFAPDVAARILKAIKRHEAEYLIDGDWNYCYTGDDEHPIRRNLDPHKLARNVSPDALGGIVKVVVLRAEDFARLHTRLAELPIVISAHGNEDILDLSPTGIDKWAGLQRLGVKSGEFVAFGNDANDLSMFRRAARSVCVGEHAGLLAVATEQIPCDEESVVRKIAELAAELRGRAVSPAGLILDSHRVE